LSDRFIPPTFYCSHFQVLTADKNALRKLAVANGCGGICLRMNGRVLCLEQILLLLIPHLGFDTLAKHVSSSPAHDDAFRLPFQPGTVQTDAEAVLQQRIDLIRAQTRNLSSWPRCCPDPSHNLTGPACPGSARPSPGGSVAKAGASCSPAASTR